MLKEMGFIKADAEVREILSPRVGVRVFAR